MRGNQTYLQFHALSAFGMPLRIDLRSGFFVPAERKWAADQAM
jgi:hypothetical protein